MDAGNVFGIAAILLAGACAAVYFADVTKKRRNVKKAFRKGQMSRVLVYYCVSVLSVCAVWAMILKTVSVINGNILDMSDVLLFVGSAFGGELLMLLAKRVFAKPKKEEENCE